VELNDAAQLVQFAYAMELQPAGARETLPVESLHVAWGFRGSCSTELKAQAQISNNRLIRMIIAACPSITALSLLWEQETVPPTDEELLDEESLRVSQG
jgi:hypothetical protein